MAVHRAYSPSPGTPGEGEGGGSRAGRDKTNLAESRGAALATKHGMKLEYLGPPAGWYKHGLIRLYDFGEHGAIWLHSVFLSLAVSKVETLALHEQPWIDSLNGCQLTLVLGPKDIGIRKVAEPLSFECVYHQQGWAELADKTKPFAVDHAKGFNWLTNEGDIELLISPSGNW